MHISRLLLPLPAAYLVVLAGCGGGSPSPSASSASPGPVQVSLGEWFVKSGSAQASAGRVTFAVTNGGKTKHEFVVLRTTKAADALGSGTRVSETGNVGETGDVAPGQSKSVTLDLKPGHYSLVCNLPGHYKLGMRTDFTVT